MIKLCATCGNRFNADADWKRECFGCWKKHKHWETERGMELARLRREVAALSKKVHEIRRAKDMAESAALEAIRQSGEMPDWASRHRKWLIQKLHPDKHNGSAIANEIVQQLLQRGGS